MEDKEHPNNQDEQTEKERQEQENIASNKIMAQIGLKGAATAAGAYFGGDAGAKIGSKAADVINNTPVGDALTDAAGKVGNEANKMSPTGDTNQKLINAAANSGALDLADKGIDAAANETGGPSSNKPENAQIQNGNKQSNQSDITNKPTPTDNQLGNGLKDKKNPNKKNSDSNDSEPSNVSNRNPSKKLPNKKRFSKHSNGEDDDPKENDKSKPKSKLRSNSLANKIMGNEESTEDSEEDGEENQSGTQTIKDLINGIRRVASVITALIAAMPLISMIGIIIAIVLIVSVFIVPMIVSISPYGSDDDGNVCFATAPCTNIILKNGEEEKRYKLDEYIAGAMVDYYDYSSVVKYTLGIPSIDDDLLKALAVIIHTDVSIYSSYDSSTSTCTINDSSKFKSIYTPTVINNDSDISDSSEEENPDNNTENTENQDQSADSNQNGSNDTSEDLQTNEDKYYYQAKKDAKSVISEVVNVYSKNLELKYTGYLQVLHNAVDAGQDYQKIIKTYIKNDPGFAKTGGTATDDDSEDTTEDDSNNIGIYPICYFEESSDSDIGVVHSDDVCSTVHINNGSNSGDYTIDQFIEGVVYNEARAWSDSIDTLKAHAVAARTYLVNRGRVENDTCYITVGTNTMGYTNNTNEAIHRAVTETSGEYIMVNGEISKQAEWDALCITNPNTTGANYTICQKKQQIPKSWFSKVKLFGTISWYNKHSHGRGMSQYGAYYLATVQNQSYREIIKYYYGADISILSSKEYIMPLNSFTYISGEVHNRCDGKSSTHKGLDLAAPKGTPVYAAHSGTIIKFYNTNFQCADHCKSGQYEGLGVKIDNGDGTYSAYMHFSSRENLSIGQKIEAGQKLGEVGNTGSARGASGGYHLHYQMGRISDGAILNPRDYLPLDEKGFGVCYRP